jgi:hypothetical protein
MGWSLWRTGRSACVATAAITDREVWQIDELQQVAMDMLAAALAGARAFVTIA